MSNWSLLKPRSSARAVGDGIHVAARDNVHPSCGPLRGLGLMPYIPPLDGLRAIAILLVLSTHFQLVPKVYFVERVLFWFTGVGWAGVQLFFVLSGYLITSILLRSLGSPTYYSAFYARRALRIAPPYYLLLAGYFLGAALLGNASAVSSLAPWYGSYLQNIQMSVSGNLGPQSLGVTWSLAVEEQFYLIWPLFVRALGLRALKRVCLAAVVAALGVRRIMYFSAHAPLAAYVLMPARIDAIAAGSLVAMLHLEGGLSAWRALGWPCLGLGAMIMAGCARMDHGFGNLKMANLTAGLAALTMIFATILGAVVLAPTGGSVARILSWPPLRSIGRYSYAMYLLHIPVRQGLTQLLPMLARADRVPRVLGTQWIAQVLFYSVAGLTTYGLARLSWVLVESRFLAMKSRRPYRLALAETAVIGARAAAFQVTENPETSLAGRPR